jgi:hypothetical protein
MHITVMSADRLDEDEKNQTCELINRLLGVAFMRANNAHKSRPPSREAASRVRITPEEATALCDVHGYPIDIITGLRADDGQPPAGDGQPPAGDGQPLASDGQPLAGGHTRQPSWPLPSSSAATMVAGCGDIEAAKYLIAQGLDFTAKDDLGMTPIEVAARMGDDEMVRYLLRAAPADVADLDGLLCSLVVDMRVDVCLSIVRMLCAASDNDYDHFRLARGAARFDHREIMIDALAQYDLHQKDMTEFSASILTTLVERFPHMTVAITEEER